MSQEACEEEEHLNEAMELCIESMQSRILIFVVVTVIISSLVMLHFLHVLFTYWMQARAEEEKDTFKDGNDDTEPLIKNCC